MTTPPSTSRPTTRAAARTALAARRAGAALAVLALAALAPGTPPAAARTTQAGAYALAGTWLSRPGDLPADAWRFAAGIDGLPDGRVFVSDRDEARLTVIRPDLSVALAQPSPGYDDGLVAPGHLAADPAAGRLYVADRGAGTGAIAVFDLDGTRVATWPGIPAPAGVAVTPDGNVVVGNGDSGEVGVYAPDGLRLAVWRVTAPDPGGDVVRGIDVDARGQVYVVDGRQPVVHVLAADGRAVDTLRVNAGEGNELFDIAVEEAVGGGTKPARYWVATARGVYWLDTRAGGSVWQISPTGSAWGVTVAAPHGIFATAPNRPGVGSRVARLPYGQNGFVIPNQLWGASLLRPGALDGPEVVAVGADAGVYVLDLGPRVQRFAADGSVAQLDQVVNPIRVDAMPDGTILVTDGGAVVAYARGPGGWAQAWRDTVAPPGRDDSTAVGLGFDPAAAEVVALDAERGALRRWSATGQRGPTINLRAAADDSTVWADLAVDAAGRAYALDRTNQTVHVVDRGGATRQVALPAPARHLAVAPDGSLFTLDRDGWVRRYDAGGATAVRTAAFDATRFDIANATAPSDLAVDAAGDVYVTDRDANAVSRFAWDGAGRPAEPPPPDVAECRAFPGKTASPADVVLGASVEVRLTVRGGCGAAAANTPRDIILILDVSGSMQGEKIRILREAALAFLADVDFASARVGIVTFTDDARVAQALTSNAAALRQAVRQIDADPAGGTAVHEGLATARAHWLPRRQTNRKPVFILLSDGGSPLGPARTEADAARADGVEIFTIGIQAWRLLMQTVASGPDHYFEADSARFLYGIFERIAERITTATLFRTLAVTDEIPANMRYVPGSAAPAAVFDAATNTLRWALADVPFNGLGLRYEVVPQAPGLWPTNVVAWGDFTDGFGRAGRLDFPVPRVRVAAPTPTDPPTDPPTATPTVAPTLTATPTAPATATPVPSATPTATPTRRPPRPIFLPILLKEIPCKPGERYADTVLVIDTSTSMTGEKIAGAKAAARLFVDLLRLPGDQAAVVGFNTQAGLASPLTGSAGALKAAVDGLALAPGTRIDRGLDAAVAELASPRRRAGNTPVIVLLTDGRQDDDPLLAIDVATRARAAGRVIFAIGLGGDVDTAFLELIAGGRARTFLAPTPADLARIYTQVAGEVPCPSEVYWGGRR